MSHSAIGATQCNGAMDATKLEPADLRNVFYPLEFYYEPMGNLIKTRHHGPRFDD